MVRRIASLGFFLGVILSRPAFAVDTPLGSFGQTDLQRNTGNTVQKTCGELSLGDQNEPLFITCRAMVHTANDLLDNEGDSTYSLGLTADELAFVLQQIATEEFDAPKRWQA